MTLFELAWAALPSEMLIPACVVNVAGMQHLIMTHTAGIQKLPEQSAWVSFVGAALVYYALSARLLRDQSSDRALIRELAPWIGSACALAGIYMLLPAPYVCASFGILAILMGKQESWRERRILLRTAAPFRW